MNISFRRLGAVLAAGLLLAGLLFAPGPAMAGKQISAKEKQIIERYFAKNPSDTSGKAKSKDMPKGMDKKLARGGTLPPGIKKTRLPTKLANKLPERPKNEELVIVDEDVVLIDTATGIILDMLEKSKMR